MNQKNSKIKSMRKKQNKNLSIFKVTKLRSRANSIPKKLINSNMKLKSPKFLSHLNSNLFGIKLINCMSDSKENINLPQINIPRLDFQYLLVDEEIDQ